MFVDLSFRCSLGEVVVSLGFVQALGRLYDKIRGCEGEGIERVNVLRRGGFVKSYQQLDLKTTQKRGFSAVLLLFCMGN